MKRIFSFLAAVLISVTMSAQTASDMMSATLIHGDQTTVFYTAKAYQQALKAAEDGDVIILSEGKFDFENITKSVTIYGSGFGTETNIYLSEVEETDGEGNVSYRYPTVRAEGLNADGFGIAYNTHGTVLKNLTMRRCMIDTFTGLNTDSKDCRFSQCVIRGQNAVSYSNSSHEGLVFDNCYFSLGRIQKMGDYTNKILFDHCIMYCDVDCIAAYTNSIFVRNTYLPSYSTASKCIFAQETDAGTDVTATGCWFGLKASDIFAAEGEDGSYSDDKDFALGNPQYYVGTDGTEVGINGGNGFSRMPAVPRIVSSEIDTRSSADGKIGVSFTVEAQTE